MTPPGRPIGELRVAVAQLLPERSSWRATEVAHALQVPVPAARYTLSRMAAAEAARVVGTAPREGAGRREALYSAPSPVGIAVFVIEGGD